MADVGTSRAVPMISYEDVGSAADWLCRAFGFQERGERFRNADGTVTHAEVEIGEALVMLGWPGPDYRSPAHHAETCDDARRWSDVPWVIDGVLIPVDDVDAHAARARAEGAAIIRELTDEPPGRLYAAADLEGHRWMFIQPPAT